MLIVCFCKIDTEPEKPVEQDKPVTKETVTEILDEKQPQTDSVMTSKLSSGMKTTPSYNGNYVSLNLNPLYNE